MKYYLHTCLVLALFGCVTSAAAQEPSAQPVQLRGTVVAKENPNQRGWGQVNVKVNIRPTNQEYKGEQRSTDDHTWFHVAPLGARVDVLFDKSCYEGDVLDDIVVRPKNPELETVKLQKTLACRLFEAKQRARPRTKTRTGNASGARVSISETETSGPGRASAIPLENVRGAAKVKVDDDLLPSPTAVKNELARGAMLARKGKFFDTFQYNFAVSREMYRSRPSLMQILLQFRRDPKNHALFERVGSVAPEAFDDVVRAQFETSGEVNLNNIKSVIKEEALSPSVRGSATVAILNRDLDEKASEEMKTYYRQQAQNPASGIFASSLVALFRMGDDSDKSKLYDDILNSKDERRVIASMEAVAATQIIEGSEALPEGSSTLAEVAATAEVPEVRAAAFYALRPFADDGDQTAINALKKGAREDTDALVRKRATQVLGFDDLEEEPGVRKVLRAVARLDPSHFVRKAARVALSGAKSIVSY